MISDEEAKAVQAVSKTVENALDKSEKLGGFINRVFGGLVEDGVGILADKVKFYRQERLIDLQERVQKNIEQRKLLETKPVQPRIGVRLIEEAAISDSDDMTTKWANLLTNAMDPKYNGEIKRSFVSILADIEPIDAKILDEVIGHYLGTSSYEQERLLYDRERLAQALHISVDDCEVALRNLLRLGLIRPGVVTGGISMGDHPVSSYKDTEMFAPTLLGVHFRNAVSNRP